jgi:hypothetical protein
MQSPKIQLSSPVAIQLRQALALFCVPEDDPPVLASARENVASKDQATVKTHSLPFSNKSVSLDTALRLSPAEGGRGRRQNRYFITTDDEKGLGGSPMSGESLVALAVCRAPQFDGFVPRPSDELPELNCKRWYVCLCVRACVRVPCVCSCTCVCVCVCSECACACLEEGKSVRECMCTGMFVCA